jgi:endogenous inhibitor of DNA gyrase (YacG/DUF329 family)
MVGGFDAINLPDSVANLYFRPPCQNLQTLLYTTTTWEGNAFKPFCSERCQTQDLSAWSSESYRVPEKPQEEDGEGWSDELPEG